MTRVLQNLAGNGWDAGITKRVLESATHSDSCPTVEPYRHDAPRRAGQCAGVSDREAGDDQINIVFFLNHPTPHHLPAALAARHERRARRCRRCQTSIYFPRGGKLKVSPARRRTGRPEGRTRTTFKKPLLVYARLSC